MIEPGGLACEGADEPCFAGAGQADDIAPKNIRLKLSSIIRIIHAHENASLLLGDSFTAVAFIL